MPKCSGHTGIIVAVVLAAAGAAAPAHAGPPLLCHPFDIGNAASLPWDGSLAYWQGRADYRVAGLVEDVERLLTPGVPVIVRMETLRRAAIYASGNEEVALRLFTTLEARVRTAKAAGRTDALAVFDVAYLTETNRQIALLDRPTSPFQGRSAVLNSIIGDRDGYAMVRQALAVRGDDPAMEFAAALMHGRRDDVFRAHAEKARAGASRDALLERNLASIS